MGLNDTMGKGTPEGMGGELHNTRGDGRGAA